jgi:hypothetical protein
MPSTQPLRLLSAREAVSRRTTPRTALLMLQNLRLARLVSRVLKALGMRTMPCENVTTAHAWIRESRPDLIIYDIDSETRESRDLLHALAHEESAPALILLSEGGDVPMLRDLASYPSGYNLVLKDGLIDNGDLLVTARKLVDRDVFGLEKYLRWGSVIHTVQAQSSAEKDTLVEQLERFLGELQCDSRYINDLANAADEFLSNAFYHGPTEDGVQINSHKSRTQVISLPTAKRPAFEFGSDGRHVGVAVRDLFGSLDTQRMLEHLAKCVEMKHAEVSRGPGGAGVGLYVTYRSVDHLIINLEPGVATEFVALIDVSLPYREHVRNAHSLNVFMLDPFAE